MRPNLRVCKSHAAPSENANYRLYRSTARDRTYLVISTFYDTGPGLGEHPGKGFVLSSAKELGAEMWQARQGLSPPSAGTRTGSAETPEAGAEEPWETSKVEVTLRTHGFNTGFSAFLAQVLDESEPDPGTTLRPNNRFYIGYRWPSAGATSSRSLADLAQAFTHTGSVSVLMFLFPALALLLRPLESGNAANTLRALLGPYATQWFALLMLGFGIGFVLLRFSTYLSDRYRALHYGVPDLAEFVRDLDDQIYPMRIRAEMDLVGHSMGCLLMVNAVRVMSDFFHFPDEDTELSRLAMVRLRSLLLCGADIPIALAVPGRNNYFLSSLRRFPSVHVLSSDHDIIPKWLSNLGNWASEPRYDMSSRRLGNAFLVAADGNPELARGMPHTGAFIPVTRPGLSYLAPTATPWRVRPGSRISTLQIHDCSRCWSVGGDMKWAVGAGAVAGLVGLGLWFSPILLGKWLASVTWLFLGVGALSRWLQYRFLDHWGWGPILGLIADWPSLTAFGWGNRNPHGGYFLRGDVPRRLLAQLVATPPVEGEVAPLVQAPAPIRSSGLVIPI